MMFFSLVCGITLVFFLNTAVGDESITATKSGATSCPPVVGSVSEGLNSVLGVRPFGQTCGKESVFHYYDCCGQAKTECCLHLQTWVIVALAVCAAIVLTSVVLSVVRCVFCRR